MLWDVHCLVWFVLLLWDVHCLVGFVLLLWDVHCLVWFVLLLWDVHCLVWFVLCYGYLLCWHTHILQVLLILSSLLEIKVAYALFYNKLLVNIVFTGKMFIKPHILINQCDQFYWTETWCIRSVVETTFFPEYLNICRSIVPFRKLISHSNHFLILQRIVHATHSC